MSETQHPRNSRTAGSIVTIVALLSAAGPSSASGQIEREGQWLAFGLGPGFDQISCGVCQGNPKPGIAGFVRFGGTVSDRLLLGGEFDGWTRGDDGIRQYLGSLSAIALLYAGPAARFHVKGGLGAVGFRASEEGDALTSLSLGLTGGVGYDFPIRENLSLTPFASLTLAPFASLKFNGDLAQSGATLSLLQGGLSLTWH
jgi:hypothetical protein